MTQHLRLMQVALLLFPDLQKALYNRIFSMQVEYPTNKVVE